MRADARRNRKATLSAARRVFAEWGLDAPLDVIAREAGVAWATQHRHFPTRESLVVAIFDENLERLTAVIERTPAADAYVAGELASVGMMVRDRGFVDLFNQRDVSTDARRDVAARVLSIIEQPLTRCSSGGACPS